MQTLSLFPSLLFLGAALSPALLRLAIAVIGLLATKERYKKNYKWASVLYFVTSFFILIGMYTQAFVLVGIAIICFDGYINNKTETLSKERKILYVLMGMTLLSLLFTGPGFMAFDIPL